VAFTVTPWLSYHLLKGQYGKGNHSLGDPRATATYRAYRAVLAPFLSSRRAAWGLIALTALLLVASCALPAVGLVPLKMLPFDNKNEFQVLVDLPEGSTVERTDAVLMDLTQE